MDYYHDFWIGFLSEQIVRQAVEMALIKCSGCEGKMHSPLLHLHHQLSLLDKLRTYFEEIRGSLLPTIDALNMNNLKTNYLIVIIWIRIRKYISTIVDSF